MLYSLKDQFLVRGISCEIVYINQGNAYVAPLEDDNFESKKIYRGCVFEIINSSGVDKQGFKAVSINSTSCFAV